MIQYICSSDIIVSWNFKHLVNQTYKGVNGVNLSRGYGFVIIVTPGDAVKIIED